MIKEKKNLAACFGLLNIWQPGYMSRLLISSRQWWWWYQITFRDYSGCHRNHDKHFNQMTSFHQQRPPEEAERTLCIKTTCAWVSGSTPCLLSAITSLRLNFLTWLFATPRTIHSPWNSPGHCSGQPFPSPEDLPNPGIAPGSLALQADGFFTNWAIREVLIRMLGEMKGLSLHTSQPSQWLIHISHYSTNTSAPVTYRHNSRVWEDTGE